MLLPTWNFIFGGCGGRAKTRAAEDSAALRRRLTRIVINTSCHRAVRRGLASQTRNWSVAIPFIFLFYKRKMWNDAEYFATRRVARAAASARGGPQLTLRSYAVPADRGPRIQQCWVRIRISSGILSVEIPIISPLRKTVKCGMTRVFSVRGQLFACGGGTHEPSTSCSPPRWVGGELRDSKESHT